MKYDGSSTLDELWSSKKLNNDNRINKKIVLNNHEFIVTNLINKDGYKMILGASRPLSGNESTRLYPRAWYFSNSENRWRAFTGFRRNGLLMKGTENNDEERAGYVFEAMANIKLHDFFNEFYDNNKKLICQFNTADFLQTYQQLFGPNNVLAESYSKERKFSHQEQLKNTLSDFSAVENKQSIQLRNDMESLKVNDMTISNMGLAKHFINNVDIQKNNSRLKDSVPLSEKLAAKINIVDADYLVNLGYKNPLNTKYYHNIIEAYYQLWLYTIPFVRMNKLGKEIKDNLVLEYCEFASGEGWINNIFWESALVTSFGNAEEVPAKLAFLVQKPIDYKAQMAFEDTKDRKTYADRYVSCNKINIESSPLLRALKTPEQLELRQQYMAKKQVDDAVINDSLDSKLKALADTQEASENMEINQLDELDKIPAQDKQSCVEIPNIAENFNSTDLQNGSEKDCNRLKYDDMDWEIVLNKRDTSTNIDDYEVIQKSNVGDTNYVETQVSNQRNLRTLFNQFSSFLCSSDKTNLDNH